MEKTKVQESVAGNESVVAAGEKGLPMVFKYREELVEWMNRVRMDAAGSEENCKDSGRRVLFILSNIDDDLEIIQGGKDIVASKIEYRNTKELFENLPVLREDVRQASARYTFHL